MKHKFDIKTAKKLLSTYAEKITFYMKENELLKNQLRDLETTLQINKYLISIHSKYFYSFPNNYPASSIRNISFNIMQQFII